MNGNRKEVSNTAGGKVESCGRIKDGVMKDRLRFLDDGKEGVRRMLMGICCM